jgi:hypothetical protein
VHRTWMAHFMPPCLGRAWCRKVDAFPVTSLTALVRGFCCNGGMGPARPGPAGPHRIGGSPPEVLTWAVHPSTTLPERSRVASPAVTVSVCSPLPASSHSVPPPTVRPEIERAESASAGARRGATAASEKARLAPPVSAAAPGHATSSSGMAPAPRAGAGLAAATAPVVAVSTAPAGSVAAAATAAPPAPAMPNAALAIATRAPAFPLREDHVPVTPTAAAAISVVRAPTPASTAPARSEDPPGWRSPRLHTGRAPHATPAIGYRLDSGPVVVVTSRRRRLGP